ncbi:MAG TPA: M20/M25/M40 family metallo-hydrolase [Bryobacteraceae bacterium]|nr:M20/M25/M40 family metallo-hydrolase [Bryobacteraceae bacterium]
MTRRHLLGVLASSASLAASTNLLRSTYSEPAGKLIGAALADSSSYDRLAYLCDRIGNRLSGSEALNKAIAWSLAEMKKDGLANVRSQPVKVPHWVRGQEELQLLAPVERKIPMLGLGRSIGTPREGLTAEVVVVSSFEELDKLPPDSVKGKIVLYDVPFVSYGETVRYRVAGASRAAALGAVAALVRSVGSASLRTPHTGGLGYDEKLPKIPAAAVTWEDAMMMHRLSNAGEKLRVRLRMDAKTLPDADSANVMGEVVGRELPDEVMVLGGHIDSWDVGQGAQDDGSGCVAAMEAVKLIHQLQLKPRRTVRVVLWTNEENGLAGGTAYRQMVGGDIEKHVAAIEMDGGAEAPRGFETSVRKPEDLATLREIGSLLRGIHAQEIALGGGGADIGPLMRDGVPGFEVKTVGERYFDWHHTDADTVDKIDPADFRANIAALAVMSYVLADMPGRLSRVMPEPRRRG